ncbi:hypothetical protein J5N97_013141 [Dioscorea zingiberensis]|uniref:Uncharacterized protein n=1 Tax=Dioscorea zingiberensis TaxID=325984 RepID=A0A9D5CSE1_9LILI|nr:hypothetical protein J5N97_013141 [Dioscorea zingiberensis]
MTLLTIFFNKPPTETQRQHRALIPISFSSPPPPSHRAPRSDLWPASKSIALATRVSKQLDVAQKIKSIALATRVSELEAVASHLRQWLTERDDLIAELRTQVETLDASASQASQQLARAQEKKVMDLRQWLAERVDMVWIKREDCSQIEEFEVMGEEQSDFQEEETPSLSFKFEYQISEVGSLSSSDEPVVVPSMVTNISKYCFLSENDFRGFVEEPESITFHCY